MDEKELEEIKKLMILHIGSLVKELEERFTKIEREIEESKENRKSELEMQLKIQNIQLAMSEININTLQNKIKNDKETITEKVTSIEIALPSFYGNNKDLHPKDFLSRIEDYFKIKNIKNMDKIILVNESLKYAAANWYDTVRLGI